MLMAEGADPAETPAVSCLSTDNEYKAVTVPERVVGYPDAYGSLIVCTRPPVANHGQGSSGNIQS